MSGTYTVSQDLSSSGPLVVVDAISPSPAQSKALAKKVTSLIPADARQPAEGCGCRFDHRICQEPDDQPCGPRDPGHEESGPGVAGGVCRRARPDDPRGHRRRSVERAPAPQVNPTAGNRRAARRSTADLRPEAAASGPACRRRLERAGQDRQGPDLDRSEWDRYADDAAPQAPPLHSRTAGERTIALRKQR